MIPGIECTLDPAILPSEKLDELDLCQKSNQAWNPETDTMHTAPMSSLRTPMRLSLAAKIPF